MAQPLIRSFVEELAGMLEFPDPIVEFGSMQVEAGQNGDLRPLFAGRDYVGTDFREGPGVDRVEDLRRLTFADGEVGTALCLDTLEHCEDPPMACRELARVTARDGGVCVISSVMLFGIHGYPNDYFRFTPEGFRAILSGFDDAWVAGVGHPDIPMQVIGVGVHGRALDLAFERFPSLVEAQRRMDDQTGKVPVGVFSYAPAELLRLVARESPRLVREKLRRVR
jgi:SAM-dependent methyltransferase